MVLTKDTPDRDPGDSPDVVVENYPAPDVDPDAPDEDTSDTPDPDQPE